MMPKRSSLPPPSSTRSAASTPVSDVSSSAMADTEEGVVEIAVDGDLVLRIEHTVGNAVLARSFRVSTPVLKEQSRYFASLLQPGRFGEAGNIEAKHESLREHYASLAEVPTEELPVLDIKDLGRISVKSTGPLLSDFLYILHGKDTQTSPPVVNLANLAIVADRFDALQTVRSYVNRKKMIRALAGKTSEKADSALSEEKVRQRLLVGLLLDYAPWVETYSRRMIVEGWVGQEHPTSAAQWWDLPQGLEEELAYRRDCILETIQSLQTHFLGLYTSRERQCKLGYDSSPQCDSFQLGEMIRFFSRVGTLRPQGLIVDTAEPTEAYNGDIATLLDTLRQVPEYQIDRFHSHCGIRTRLVPLLDVLTLCLKFVRICSDCWQNHRAEYAWLGAKRPLVWRNAQFRLSDGQHEDRHVAVRDMFTTAEHDWS